MYPLIVKCEMRSFRFVFIRSNPINRYMFHMQRCSVGNVFFCCFSAFPGQFAFVLRVIYRNIPCIVAEIGYYASHLYDVPVCCVKFAMVSDTTHSQSKSIEMQPKQFFHLEHKLSHRVLQTFFLLFATRVRLRNRFFCS